MTEQRYKTILNIHMADRLLKAGHKLVELKPSNSMRGRAVFIFEYSEELDRDMYRLARRNVEK